MRRSAGYLAEAMLVEVDACLRSPSRVVVNAVGRIGHHQIRLHARKHFPDVCRDGAVPAQKTMAAEHPDIARSRHRHNRWLWRIVGIGEPAVAATQRALDLLPKGHAMRLSAEWQLKHCQQLLALQQRLPKALQGEQLSPAEYLALADLCQRYLKRYRDAVALYAKTFAGEPKLVEQAGNCYQAACAAALAAGWTGLAS
jgi:hypothetical protein